MMKHIYILAILLLCCACEAPLDLNRIDSSPCIMANTLIGNAEPSRIYVKTAVPMNSGDKSLGEKREEKQNQKSLKFLILFGILGIILM